ncbi:MULTISPECIES: hypothetical protein [unclassified Ensifer]|uniref:hypothetical protein n=1 Tax=unclassified Ensifer TaxID=2633371 RepID=UPI0008139C8F|nr:MULTISPECIES: hypothetical protein [unclassified Ensifer]OCP05512.1 hypothetical protein BC362_13620 [Ensifer sp. LC14]OCP06942.1 hypothetical protein BBX50_22815 [Ensifer sp. LC11]OCP07400.1 hypothetical protein BC374_23030 [Ensifer sp. LC13]OCP31701.1 hypothetical protein BC364_22280 [Ensifer sp. LC499]
MAIGDQQDVGVEPTASPLSDAEVLTQLDRIRQSAEFDAPDRDRKFLAYVVEETLAGRGDRIKAYSIATEVFGRDSSFDPQTDPAVRIEAGRIRRALERYYLVAGRSDPIVIKMPKGAYVPTFERRTDARPATGRGSVTAPGPIAFIQRFRRRIVLGAVALACGLAGLSATVLLFPAESEPAGGIGRPNIPLLVVSPFEDLSGTQQSARMARGLTEEVVGNIARFKEINLVSRPGSKDALQTPDDPTYALEGQVRLEGERLRLVVRLVRRSDGSVLWANAYDERLQSQEIIDLQAKTAAAVAGAVAQPYGAVFQAKAAQFKRSVPDEWRAYACTLAYYDQRGDFDLQSHRSVQECLQRTTRQFPTYATAWALLSMTHVDAFRYHFDRLASPGALEQASEAASRALDLAPLDVRALEAQMLVFFFRGDIDAALATGARALAINPNDAELAGEYGLRLALSGQWDTGCKLLSESAARNLGQAGYFEAALATCAYFGNDYVAAERWARLANLRANPAYHVLLLAILGKLGKISQAQEERTWLETNAPRFLDNIGAEVALRLRRPEDQHRLLDGLRAAGVPVPDAEFQQARTGTPMR